VENHVDSVAKDPVCGMNVDRTSGALTSSHNGKAYYFCAEGCKKAFEKNPNRYLKPKGFFGRFLSRLSQANKEQFGTKGPSCCH
jgi:Cu+-exporting ATPase